MQFEASFIEAYAGSVTANVLLARPGGEGAEESHSVLSLSRVIEFPDCSYYFEINDQSYSSYGGLTDVEVSPTSLRVRVDEGLVEQFGNPDFATVDVRFQLSPERYGEVLAMLQRIFDGEPGLLRVTSSPE